MVREEKIFIWTCDKCKQYRHTSKGFEPLLPAGWSERSWDSLPIHVCPQCVRAEIAAAEKLEREKHKAESEARVAAEVAEEKPKYCTGCLCRLDGTQEHAPDCPVEQERQDKADDDTYPE